MILYKRVCGSEKQGLKIFYCSEEQIFEMISIGSVE